MVADLLGKEASLFLPSGTMCNQIALAVQCRPGSYIVLDRTGHPLTSEAGAAAILSGATMVPLDGEKGQYTVAQMRELIGPASRYTPPVAVVSVEQTTNRPGGRIWPLEQMREVCAEGRRLGAKTHMDGARLLNAVVASGIAAKDYAETFDSVWIDLSKGLAAPVGGVLAGSADFIAEAWQWKQRIGGAMRQAGIIAAAGIYALEHHVDRLAEDHANARRFVELISDVPGVAADLADVETNIVRFDVEELGIPAPDFAERLEAEEGVRLSVLSATALRAVAHIDISSDDIQTAADAVRALCGRISKAS
jgi:threonine aldolase